MAVADFTDEQVREWMKGKSPDEVAAAAANYGFDANTVQQAYKLAGQDYSTDQINNYASTHGYKTDPTGKFQFRSQPAAAAYGDSLRGQKGGQLWNFETNRNIYLGNEANAAGGITPAQVKAWFAANPNATNEQLAQMASQYHMTPENVAQALSIGRGYDYNPQAVRDWLGGQSAYRIENDGMISAPGRRSNGTNGSADGRPFGQYGPDGQGYDESGTLNTGTMNTYGPGGTNTNGAGGTGGTGGTGTGNGSTGTGSSTTAGGSSGPGVWNVEPNQTVESRVAGILASGNPLVEQRRAQSNMQMNARGLVNSSIAQTAGDSAAYSAALDIARPDAATYADAAKTNAGARTSWGISQNNNQTSRDNTQANIVAQRELQRATQLYNNLANQTASASSIQTWGLNTITQIQASDLSADAKNAAIASIQQYLADSYMIQGDWHTSAARAIDAIFD